MVAWPLLHMQSACPEEVAIQELEHVPVALLVANQLGVDGSFAWRQLAEQGVQLLAAVGCRSMCGRDPLMVLDGLMCDVCQVFGNVPKVDWCYVQATSPSPGRSTSTTRRAALAGSEADDPSAWSHRRPVIALALVGCGIASYLSLYQWHVTSSVWDPLFGTRSSEAVLTSFVSRLAPVPDATLGAIAYLVEAALAALGGPARWRTAPRLVLLFGLVLAGLALTSLALVLSQVLLVHALCTLCLGSAAISWLNAWLGRHEVMASLAHRRGGG